ncbi:hypothetical protein EHQ76_06805 [Leptospira barantonii]|uniref:Uncharacterized protein n=1 Tax=Leptospira barantonii TaxID=2023184 RepID=A0A5F2BP58_9LEPT|nr:hypothetical protein [Leptospira barantonii]TGM05970.1 hypothetical protein EHQ76_06805 [Leptospira barantonii]
MSHSSSIIPIHAKEFFSNNNGKILSLPVLVYRISDDEDHLIYVEVLSYGILGSGRDFQEAVDDLIETLKLYIEKVSSTPKIISVTQSSDVKIEKYKELFFKEKLNASGDNSNSKNIDELKSIDPTKLQIAI